ncbi:centriole, cilia and spindle-associated protein isoform X2 [Cynocephalus volans]|uniref:centriole, cilia and spindle-associated protein isoform X2 n=1 Tax=Cynocephalus volans TaxID=110931 RepID=UPI002FC748F6
MAPGSRAQSEYMKRFRRPRWDECGPCYRELLRYRRGRRLLEQAHAPWLWDDGDESASSASSGAGDPAPPCAPASPAEPPEERDAALPALPVKDVEDEPEQVRTAEPDRSPAIVQPRQQPSALFSRGTRKAVRSPQRSSRIKENKHPFALYGWGEKQTDTGSQKTHNVCASAPEHEIHESALRAKNRRQVEKRKLFAQRQRAHSVDVERNRRLVSSSAESPWVTEYMRCYSARA